MAIFHASTYTYSDTTKLIALLKAESIDARVDQGGVMVCPQPQQVNRAREICLQSGASFDPGYGGDDTSDIAYRVHANARAVAKEWKV